MRPPRATPSAATSVVPCDRLPLQQELCRDHSGADPHLRMVLRNITPFSGAAPPSAGSRRVTSEFASNPGSHRTAQESASRGGNPAPHRRASRSQCSRCGPRSWRCRAPWTAPPHPRRRYGGSPATGQLPRGAAESCRALCLRASPAPRLTARSTRNGRPCRRPSCSRPSPA